MEAAIDLKTQYRHAVLPKTVSDEASRQEFVKSLKLHLASKVAPGNRLAYEARAGKAYAAATGSAPANYHEIRKAMADDPYFRFWSALQRNSQEMMWNAVQVPVQRSLDTLIDVGRTEGDAGGTLTLNPDMEIPRYHRMVDIHCMPGGYHTDFAQNDVANGAVYDRAVYLYAMGRMGPFNSDIGDTTIAYLKQNFPDLKPRRILDMGCTVGHSTLPYCDAYPEAEVYGIDVGAPVLRYAHARAQDLGQKVHFSQQNAEHTNFDDGFFDLIVSHILVHETSHKAMRNIMREAHRLLSPGGVVIHAETPPYRALEAFDAFMLDWDTRNNNEPYWGASHEIVSADIARETGFDPAKAFEGMQTSVFDAAEAERTKVFQGGDFGGAGMWYVWGAQK
ncbi:MULTISPECIES: class I SAM-dependent methyltransferase [Sphingobium]|uniref:Methyltransferase type 12 n=1 Tax=Sphingobium chungbukense TaxID=56193 RepID=A0A0M3AMC6_9SPHN|nr:MULTISPECIES: class I SAM-dependent methyltransferase [Sphingobium]KKW91292.1 methyltransferase type 12 [Sphingobium chungbukense]PJG47599.1 SAM-dependent methyltransferase [Sphingobium sp. LB126]